ncbi:hypothetical protein CK203_058916 [Vitis vinifera]|uniref:Uncharacterized protein n=1 Tax=Vitis vinifera TaxID=29760 RepID=A0A438FS65_VITVI|nr:hypothetical protein CK203_058916 [Vitis vinifera]
MTRFEAAAEHQARISIWSLLASSSTHRDALTRALSQIRVDTTTTLEGLIHMMTAGRATCITMVGPERMSSGHRHRSGYAPSDFGPSTQTVRAYDSTRREVMGTLEIELLIGPTTFITIFQVVAVQSAGDMFISVEPVLQISHSDDDLLLTEFTFDEVQTLELGDFCRDFVAMSFDQHGSTVVLDIMRGMSYLPGMGLGRRQHGRASSSPFLIMTYHLGSGSSPLRLIIDIWHDCAGRGEGSTDSYAV